MNSGRRTSRAGPGLSEDGQVVSITKLVLGWFYYRRWSRSWNRKILEILINLWEKFDENRRNLRSVLSDCFLKNPFFWKMKIRMNPYKIRTQNSKIRTNRLFIAVLSPSTVISYCINVELLIKTVQTLKYNRWRWKSTCAQISYFFSLGFFVIPWWWESKTPQISISNFMMLDIELGNVMVVSGLLTKFLISMGKNMLYHIYTFVPRLATCMNIRTPLSLCERAVFTCVRTFTCSHT